MVLNQIQLLVCISKYYHIYWIYLLILYEIYYYIILNIVDDTGVANKNDGELYELTGKNDNTGATPIKCGAIKSKKIKKIADKNVLIKKEKNINFCEKCGEYKELENKEVKKELKNDLKSFKSQKIKSMYII